MRILFLIVLLLETGAPAIAGGTIDASTTLDTLSSASGAYGPWVYEDLDVTLPPQGTTGIHFENRRASDKFNPTTHSFFGLDTYQRFSHSFTLYAGMFSGTGAPYPRFRFNAEAQIAAGAGFVPFAGGSVGSGYGIGATHSLTVGTYYYFGDNYAVVRYTPSWSQALGQVQGYSAALALGHPGKTVHTFRIGSGGENDISLISPVNPTIIGERDFSASYSVKQWLAKTSGVHAGITYSTLTRTGGARIYSGLGFTLGAFLGI